jgi:hypothetical protein
MPLDIPRDNKDPKREEEALKLERHISPQYTAPNSFSAGIYIMLGPRVA